MNLDLSPFVTDIYYSIREKKIDICNIDGLVNRLVFGLLPSEQHSFKGIQFLEDGTVYIGEGVNTNEYDLTGKYIRLKIDGEATFGHFNKGEIVKCMTQEEYFKMYTTKSAGQEKIDLLANYLSTPNCRKYLIIAMQTKFDLDIGPILSINALPFDTLEIQKNGKLNYTIKQMEYFYLYAEERIVQLIQENSNKQRLWNVNLDDFNTHFDYVTDMSSQQVLERNIHLHNGLIGLEYSNIIDFDSMNVIERLENSEL